MPTSLMRLRWRGAPSRTTCGCRLLTNRDSQAHIHQELATLLKACMPLVQSLDILRQRVSNPLLKGVLDDVFDRVRAGSSLSDPRGSLRNT